MQRYKTLREKRYEELLRLRNSIIVAGIINVIIHLVALLILYFWRG